MIERISDGAQLVAASYGFSSPVQFVQHHLEQLSTSGSELAERCSAVLQQATIGFGMGADTSLVIIGVGRTLLGSPLAGAPVVTSMSNPVTMTCAAVGAIYFGWKALSDAERQRIVAEIARAFSLGPQLIISIVRFAIDTLRTLSNAQRLTEFKKPIAEVAASFGRSLGDVTHSIVDRTTGAFATVRSSAASVGSRLRLPYRTG